MFRLALRQAEGLISTVLRLPGLALAVPGHVALCRRARTLELPGPRLRKGGEPPHPLVEDI